MCLFAKSSQSCFFSASWVDFNAQCISPLRAPTSPACLWTACNFELNFTFGSRRHWVCSGKHFGRIRLPLMHKTPICGLLLIQVDQWVSHQIHCDNPQFSSGNCRLRTNVHPGWSSLLASNCLDKEHPFLGQTKPGLTELSTHLELTKTISIPLWVVWSSTRQAPL